MTATSGAFVSLRDGFDVTAGEVLNHLKKSLANASCQLILTVPEIRKNPVGQDHKVGKFAIAQPGR